MNMLYIGFAISFCFGLYGMYRLYLDMTADDYYDKTVNKCKKLIRQAYEKSDNIVADATEEANKMKAVAFSESQKMLLDAKSQSDTMIANTKVDISLMQAEARKQVEEVDMALADMRKQLDALDDNIHNFSSDVEKTNFGLSIGVDAATGTAEITKENSSMFF